MYRVLYVFVLYLYLFCILYCATLASGRHSGVHPVPTSAGLPALRADRAPSTALRESVSPVPP